MYEVLRRSALGLGLLIFKACNSVDPESLEKVLQDPSTRFALLPRELHCMILGTTLLHVACREGALERVENYLLEGLDKNAVDIFGRTPLYLACQNGQVKVVDSLLKHGVNTTQATTNGLTSFFVACIYGHSEVVELLLKKEVDGAGSCNAITPLFAACENGHTRVVELLLSQN